MDIKAYEKWKVETAEKPGFRKRYEAFMENVSEFARRHNITVESAMSIISDDKGIDSFRNFVELDDFLVAWEWRKVEIVEKILMKTKVDTDRVPNGFYSIMYFVSHNGDMSTMQPKCSSDFTEVCRWIDAKVTNAVRVDHYSHAKRFEWAGDAFELTIDIGQGTNYFLSKIHSVKEELTELP